MEELLGVTPEQVVDLMALRGDSVDNVPGAPGIGDKGSVELIQQFGTLDALLERAGEVQKKTYRESLQQNREMILLSKELVTIDCNVAIPFEPEVMRAQEPDVAAARELFGELEFTTLQKEFLSSGEAVGETKYGELTDAALEKLAKARDAGDCAECGGAADRGRGERWREARSDAEDAPEQGSLALGEPRRRRQRLAPACGNADGAAGWRGAGSRLRSAARQAESYTAELSGAHGARIAQLLADGAVVKAVHDVKSTLHALSDSGTEAGRGGSTTRCCTRICWTRLTARTRCRRWRCGGWG